MPSLEQARTDGLRLLKFRPRSEEELRRRLGQKGFDDSTRETVIQEFKRKGLLDDDKFARYFVAQKVMAKPVGRRLLLNRLREKGIQPETAAQAVEAGTEGQDERAQARGLAFKRKSQLKGLTRETVRRRLFGYLSRRGFSGDAVIWAVRQAVESKGEEID